jgi:hypothetical protein
MLTLHAAVLPPSAALPLPEAAALALPTATALALPTAPALPLPTAAALAFPTVAALALPTAATLPNQCLAEQKARTKRAVRHFFKRLQMFNFVKVPIGHHGQPEGDSFATRFENNIQKVQSLFRPLR